MAKNISEALEQPSLSSVDSCVDCEQLMYELKEELNISDRMQKVQILTLVPDRWSIDQVSKFFCVRNYLARQARQQKIDGGILSLPPKQTRNQISDDLQEKVNAFYESDEVSRMCPGKRTVSK